MSADAQLLSRTSGSLLAINQAEPLFALGRWDEALRVANGAMDLYLAPGPMHRALLQVITGSIVLARGDLAAGGPGVLAARDALGSARYEDQHQLPLARLEILSALARTARPPRSRPRRRPWTASSCPAAARDTPGRWWPPGRARSWPPPGWPESPTTSGSATRRPPSPTGCARSRRSWRRSARPSEPAELTFAAADAHAARLLAAFSVPPSRCARPGGGGRGEPAGILAAWDQAAAAWADLSEPYPLAQTLLLAADAALACGDRDGVAERLQRAAPLAAGLGARPLSEQIAILARRARIRLASDDASEG